MIKKILIPVCTLIAIASHVQATEVTRVIAVTVQRAELGPRKVYVRTVDGKEQVFTFSRNVDISSLAEAAINKSLHGGAGYQFLLHYTLKYGEITATAFDYVGRDDWKEWQGAVTSVNPSAMTVTMKSADGAEEVFTAGVHCLVETPSEIKPFAAWAAAENHEEGVVVRYMVTGSRKIAHLLEIPEAPPAGR